MDLTVRRRTSATSPKIERGIPLPKPSAGNRSPWPFVAMKPGESFRSASKRVLAAAYKQNHRAGRQLFAVRKDGRGWRVWRVGKARA